MKKAYGQKRQKLKDKKNIGSGVTLIGIRIRAVY